MAFGSKTTLASEKAAKAAEPVAEITPSVAPTQELPAEPAEGAAAPIAEAAQPAAIPPDKQAAIDKILADARSAAQAILLAHPSEKLGTPSGDIEQKTEAVQRDRLRGTRRKDKTYVPEYVYDEDQGFDRKVLLHSDYNYMLVDGDSIDNYTLNGFKMALFDGGSRSGLTERGFRGTGDNVFRRDIYGRCQRGDCFLMYIPKAGWLELAQEDRERIDKAVPAALGSFANAAYGVGIRPFIEADGKSLT